MLKSSANREWCLRYYDSLQIEWSIIIFITPLSNPSSCTGCASPGRLVFYEYHCAMFMPTYNTTIGCLVWRMSCYLLYSIVSAAVSATSALASFLTPFIWVLDAQTTTQPFLICRWERIGWCRRIGWRCWCVMLMTGICCVLGIVGRKKYPASPGLCQTGNRELIGTQE